MTLISPEPHRMPLYAEVAGNIKNMEYQDMKVETASYVRLGRIVTAGSGLNLCEVASDLDISPAGVVCRERTNLKYLEDSDHRSNDFSVDDIVGVGSGPGVIFRCVSAGVIAFKRRVRCASQGRVQAYLTTEDSRSVVGTSLSETTAANQDVLVEWDR